VPVAVLQLLRGRVWPALPVLALVYESFTALRFIPLFMMVAFIFAGWLVWRRVLPVPPIPAWTPLFPRTLGTVALPANVAAVVAVIATLVEPSQFRREPLSFYFPEEAADLILAEYPDARIFNTYDYGGYLIHRFDGKQRVYVDGREEMYGEPFMRQYWSVLTGKPGWEEALDDADIDVAVVLKIDGLRDRLADAPDWKRVAADDYSVMFVREP
jgi:hypothetical protein